MNDKYISIKEYAEKRGCSTSAVYKRLSTTLQPYVETVGKQKMLKIEVLEMEDFNHSTTPPPQSSTHPPQPSTTPLKSYFEEDKERLIQSLEDRIEELKEEIKKIEEKAKEDTIFLKQQIEIKDKQIENQQILIDQQQKLNALSLNKEENILTEPKEESNIENNKKGFFSKLFR